MYAMPWDDRYGGDKFLTYFIRFLCCAAMYYIFRFMTWREKVS